MKRIINGKLYNTETAKEMGIYYSDYARNDFDYYEETLYKKKTGEFFLYGFGNAASKYAKSAFGGGQCGGENIKPLTEEQAKKWTENHLEADEYIEIFGEVEE